MGVFYNIDSGNNKFLQSVSMLTESGNYKLAFIALDISNFKYINDYYGMEEGDKVIKDIAAYFFINEPLCLTAYGMGFDQFRGVYDMQDKTKEQMIDYLNEKSIGFEHELTERYPLVYNHVYIGVYFYDDMDVDYRRAIDWSNLAKKTIKNNLNVNCKVFDADNGMEHLKNMHISNTFMHCVENDKIELYIQPKVSYAKHSIVGGEALARLKDDQDNIIMPASFVPVLERTGLVNLLDRIMIEKVFAFQRKCIDAGENVYPISVNVSKQEFLTSYFADNIFKLQEKYDIDPQLISFELVESTFINEMSNILGTIDKLRDSGYKINVDDFGAGYSSLNQIANIPADIIKMDGLFARKSLNTEKGRKVIRALISMLNDVKYDIVFEGIESKEQLELIVSYGCDVIQGFYYSRPIRSEEFEKKYGSESAVAS